MTETGKIGCGGGRDFTNKNQKVKWLVIAQDFIVE